MIKKKNKNNENKKDYKINIRKSLPLLSIFFAVQAFYTSFNSLDFCKDKW